MVFSTRIVKLGNGKCFAECDQNNILSLYYSKDNRCFKKTLEYNNDSFELSSIISEIDADEVVKAKEITIKRKGKILI